MSTLHLYSPSGVVKEAAATRRAARWLADRGFEVTVDVSATAKHQRFAGTDQTRLEALHRVAQAQPSVALATRGGYGLTRLLPHVNWDLIGQSLDAGTRWVGYSDVTALHLGALAHGAWRTAKGTATKPAPRGALWAGPMACGDFGVAPGQVVDDITEACFLEAMGGELEGIGFRAQAGHDGLDVEGRLWGGNLAMVASLLGTPHFPKIKGGILFLEDVGELHYRTERLLLQLAHAGVLDQQCAVLLGSFSEVPKSPLDRGYNFKSVVAQVQAATRTPILTGLPFGHVPTKVCLPVGWRAQLVVQGRDALMAW